MPKRKGKGKKDPVTGGALIVDGYRRVFRGLKAGMKGFKKGFKG